MADRFRLFSVLALPASARTTEESTPCTLSIHLQLDSRGLGPRIQHAARKAPPFFHRAPCVRAGGHASESAIGGQGESVAAPSERAVGEGAPRRQAQTRCGQAVPCTKLLV